MQWETTCSSNWMEFGWKNVICFFLTPDQKSHQNVSSACWRLCGNPKANHYHLFWSFPKVNSFCQDIHKCLETILSAQLPFDFLHMYLGQEPLNITTPADKCLLRIIIMSAEKTLTRHWLNQTYQEYKNFTILCTKYS